MTGQKKNIRSGSPPIRKINVFWRARYKLLLRTAVILAVTLVSLSAGAEDAVEALYKLEKFIGTVRSYVETLSANEQGEKELLEYLASVTKSNKDINTQCTEAVQEAGEDTNLEQYTLLFCGLLPDISPKEMVKIVKENLAQDGFTFLTEDKSWGTRTIWFEKNPGKEPRDKRYVLWMYYGVTRSLTDLVLWRDTSGSFCLAKAEKI